MSTLKTLLYQTTLSARLMDLTSILTGLSASWLFIKARVFVLTSLALAITQFVEVVLGKCF